MVGRVERGQQTARAYTCEEGGLTRKALVFVERGAAAHKSEGPLALEVGRYRLASGRALPTDTELQGVRRYGVWYLGAVWGWSRGVRGWMGVGMEMEWRMCVDGRGGFDFMFVR